MKIAVIPARGGSKRIPRKNIKLFCGKPMIAWSIEAALKSGCFEQVIVSTDDPEIAQISVAYGAVAPFFRPPELSGDHVGTSPVVQHAIQWCLNDGIPVEQVCCLYATAPFVSPNDLVHGLRVLEEKTADFTFSVTSYAFPIQRAIRIAASGRVEMFNPEKFNVRSQDLEEAFHDAGQFYWGLASAWLKGEAIFGPNSFAIPLLRHRVQDIDTMEDWQRAEWLFKAMQAESE